jgi:hypothetical protein
MVQVGRCGNFGLHFVWLAACGEACSFARVRGVTTSEFLSASQKRTKTCLLLNNNTQSLTWRSLS